MEILFKDVVTIGFFTWAPFKDPQDEFRAKAYDEWNIDIPTNNEVDSDDLGDGNGVQEDVNELTLSTSTQRRKRKRSMKVDKGSYASRLCDQMDRMLNDYDSINNESNNNVPDIATCLEMLKNLQGLEYGSELFYIGVRLM